MSDTITVTGNITQPELRHTNAGVPVVNFRIGSTQRVFNRDEGRWTDGDTNWFSVSAFRGLAQHVFNSLHRGDRVVVTGRLRLRKWESANSSGLTAEIEAESVGHDLRWGTTTFQRQRGDRADGGDPDEQTVAGDGSWSTASLGAAPATVPSGSGDGWAPPLSESIPAGTASAPADDPDGPVLESVGANGGAAADRPF